MSYLWTLTVMTYVWSTTYYYANFVDDGGAPIISTHISKADLLSETYLDYMYLYYYQVQSVIAYRLFNVLFSKFKIIYIVYSYMAYYIHETSISSFRAPLSSWRYLQQYKQRKCFHNDEEVVRCFLFFFF